MSRTTSTSKCWTSTIPAVCCFRDVSVRIIFHPLPMDVVRTIFIPASPLNESDCCSSLFSLTWSWLPFDEY